MSASDVRVKAGAFAPPLARLTALTTRQAQILFHQAIDASRSPQAWASGSLHGSPSAQNGVEDGEQFARHGDQRDHLLFAGGDEALVESLQRAIVLDRHQGPHEEGAAHVAAYEPNSSFARSNGSVRILKISGARKGVSGCCQT